MLLPVGMRRLRRRSRRPIPEAEVGEELYVYAECREVDGAWAAWAELRPRLGDEVEGPELEDEEEDEGKGVDGPAIDGPGSPASDGGEEPAALGLLGPAPGLARRAINASSRERVFIVLCCVYWWNGIVLGRTSEVLARQHGMPVAGIVRSLTDGVEWCEGMETLRMRDTGESEMRWD